MPLVTGPLDLSIRLALQERETEVGVARGTNFRDHVIELVSQYQNGTGANKQGVVWSARPTLTALVTYDLAGGITSVLNKSALSMPLLIGIFIKNLSSTPGAYVAMGAAVSQINTIFNAAGDAIRIGPGGMLALWNPIDGYAVTAGSADGLGLTPAVNPTDVDIVLVGRAS